VRTQLQTEQHTPRKERAQQERSTRRLIFTVKCLVCSPETLCSQSDFSLDAETFNSRQVLPSTRIPQPALALPSFAAGVALAHLSAAQGISEQNASCFLAYAGLELI